MVRRTKTISHEWNYPKHGKGDNMDDDAHDPDFAKYGWSWTQSSSWWAPVTKSRGRPQRIHRRVERIVFVVLDII